ncbi:hypothetical protein CF162_22440 [Parabacteroides distasonis]|nr:hypothetical protein CF162_22440 [Parabacteroides distasonis]
MRFLGLDINIRRSQKKEPVESFVNVQRFGGGSSRKPAMTLAAVYRCVNVISESVAQLPLDTFKKIMRDIKAPMLGIPLTTFSGSSLTRI